MLKNICRITKTIKMIGITNMIESSDVFDGLRAFEASQNLSEAAE